MEYRTWSDRWKEIAKYYKRQYDIERGIRCELCEKKLNQQEYGVCKGCEKILVDAMNEPVTRVLNPEAADVCAFCGDKLDDSIESSSCGSCNRIVE